MDEEFNEAAINTLDQGINDALVRFGGQLSQVETSLLSDLLESLDEFDLARGNIKKSAQNLRAINDVRRKLRAAQQDGKYGQAVRDLVGEFAAQAKILDGYFTSLRIGYSRGNKLYGALVDEYITQTSAQLYTGAFGATLEPQIIAALQTHVTTGAPIAELRKSVSAIVQGNKTLANQAEAIADNALNQFSRNYMQAVSDDLGLKHYFYKGTVIATTRPFCKERAGKYYTEAEVLDWADLQFAGKIKGTDRANIKTNLGGNRCRHRLVPITETLYNAKTGKSGQLGLF